MFNAIVRFSLNNRLLVLAAAAMLMLYGAVMASRTPAIARPSCATKCWRATNSSTSPPTPAS